MISVLCLYPGTLVLSAQSQIFVYVASGADSAGAGALPTLTVLDASTNAVVKRLPLAGATSVSSVRISRDGSRVYVESTTATGNVLTVIDARHHRLLTTYSLGVVTSCAVSDDVADPEKVANGLTVDLSPSVLYRRNCQTRTITRLDAGTGASGPTLTPTNSFGGVEAPPTVGRFFLPEWSASGAMLREYDGMTNSVKAAVMLASTIDLAPDVLLSTDLSTLFIVARRNGSSCAQTLPTGRVVEMDSTSLLVNREYSVADRVPLRVLEAPAAHRLYAVDIGVAASTSSSSACPSVVSTPPIVHVFDTATGALLQSLAYDSYDDPQIGAITPDGSWGFTPSSDGLRRWDMTAAALNVNTTNARVPSKFDHRVIAMTPYGASACSYTVTLPQGAWTPTGGTASATVTTDCAWDASVDDTWAHLDVTNGDSGTTTLTLTVDPNTGWANRSTTLTVAGQTRTLTQAGSASAAAFGVVDTPSELAQVSGNIAVTGWTLDDIGVTRVRIMRDPVAGETGEIYIGDATFIDGARPDVQQSYPAYPNSSAAGWGHMVLTNMLPGGGNGTYRLHADAEDLEGHVTRLGSRTITGTNATSTQPFGTIDTPGQGATVSGTITIFGWALTPAPSVIPFDGSTIDVIIDGSVVGHPVYNNFRSDVATLFPGYANTNGAVGYLTFDAGTLTNGLHSISWRVTDNAGHVAGIGSRFFTVNNP